MEIIKRYVSNLDSDLVLLTVGCLSGKYFVEVFGEKIEEFSTEEAAISYAEESLRNFYTPNK